VSNFVLSGNVFRETDNYQLIDLSKSTSFTIPVKAGDYHRFGFLLGVDSVRNYSGAQAGVLDPMNDMFWTWNSGYVHFKMEGSSPESNTRNNRLEYHIGGYRWPNNTATPVMLDVKSLLIKKGETTELDIEVNLDKYWAAKDTLTISRTSICTLPGKLAKDISQNLPYLFSVKNIRP